MGIVRHKLPAQLALHLVFVGGCLPMPVLPRCEMSHIMLVLVPERTLLMFFDALYALAQWQLFLD